MQGRQAGNGAVVLVRVPCLVAALPSRPRREREKRDEKQEREERERGMPGDYSYFRDEMRETELK